MAETTTPEPPSTAPVAESSSTPTVVAVEDVRPPRRTSKAAKAARDESVVAKTGKRVAESVSARMRRVRPNEDAVEEEVPSGSRPVLVEYKHVGAVYEGNPVLHDVSVKLYRGEFISLVGPSGAGKSTFIRCLTRQMRPTAGEVVVAGRDITKLHQWELPYYRRKVGVVFQDFKLLPRKTVWENVAFALEVSDVPTREVRRRVALMLETVGMLEKRSQFPHQLSGGEQQRVAIARALVHDPKILIADEPTGNLDPVNTWEIIELLYKINKTGTMVLLATHDHEIVDTLKRRVITIRDGHIVADQEKGTYMV